jgi:hypothetical protein
MGACYDVNLKVRFKDVDGARKALFAKIARGRQEHVLYDMQGLRMKGFDFDNIWDLMSVFFCGWGERFYQQGDWEKSQEMQKEGVWLWSGFDACYRWESVMIDAFEKIAPYLEDGSQIKIYPDSDYDHLVVKDGKAVMIH